MSFNNLLSTYFGLHLTCQHLSIHMCAAHRCVKAYHNNSILPHAHPVSTWHVWVIPAQSGTIAKIRWCCCCAAKDVGDTLAYPADLLYIRVSAIEIRSIQADDCLICKLVWLHLVLIEISQENSMPSDYFSVCSHLSAWQGRSSWHPKKQKPQKIAYILSHIMGDRRL